MSANADPPKAHGPEDPPDAEWFTLTEGMDPYDRFRYVVRHVILAALDDVRAYVEDERIFPDLEASEALEAHLTDLEQRIENDEELSPVERRFLCIAVSQAMEDQDMEGACSWHELVRLAATQRQQRF